VLRSKGHITITMNAVTRDQANKTTEYNIQIIAGEGAVVNIYTGEQQLPNLPCVGILKRILQ
jgi:hypothetical protein